LRRTEREAPEHAGPPAEADDPHRARLLVRSTQTVVTVTYRDKTGRERNAPCKPRNRAGVLDAAMILAENLVTDQTDALLANGRCASAGRRRLEAAGRGGEEPARRARDASTHATGGCSLLLYPIASNLGKPNVSTQFALDAL